MPATIRTTLALALALAAAACGREDPDVNALDQALSGNAANQADPALTSALADQIMVDPALAQSSNRNAIRGPDGPATAPIPPDTAPGGQAAAPGGTLRTPAPTRRDGRLSTETTLGALAAAQQGGASGCADRLDYSTGWAARLPATFPVYPGGRVYEGAGSDDPGCALRVASFRADAPLQSVLDWYYTRAIGAGYSAEHQLSGSDHILAGARERDDTAYFLVIAEKGGRTEVDVITSPAG